MSFLDRFLFPLILFFIGLSIRYFEDLKKHKAITKEFKRSFRNFWYCLVIGMLLLGFNIGINIQGHNSSFQYLIQPKIDTLENKVIVKNLVK